MALEALLADGIAHAGAGVALALLDFITYKLANPRITRLEQKKACLQAIEILLDAEQSQEAEDSETAETTSEKISSLTKDSAQYAEHIAAVRDYLRTTGIVKLQLPVVDRIKHGLSNLILHEKLNILSNMQKLWVSAVLEILYDVVFDFSLRAVAGIAATLYQIPAFFVGLWFGNLIKKIINPLLIPGDERKLDKTIRQLTEDTSIIDIVVKYIPSEQVKNELAERGTDVYVSQLTQVGKGAYKRLQQIAETAKGAADDVVHFAQKQEEKEQQEREERRKRFDELTKGH